MLFLNNTMFQGGVKTPQKSHHVETPFFINKAVLQNIKYFRENRSNAVCFHKKNWIRMSMNTAYVNNNSGRKEFVKVTNPAYFLCSHSFSVFTERMNKTN